MPEIMTEPEGLGPKIHFPSEEEEHTTRRRLLAKIKRMQDEHRACTIQALDALPRLAKALTERSGQPYKLRALLYSLYNGKPASLLDIVSLDDSIREDLCLFLSGFGYEQEGAKCFYDALKAAITDSGQWEWFCAEHEEMSKLRDHLESCGYTVTPHREPI